MLIIITLGNLIIHLDGEDLEFAGSIRAKVILAYLAIEGGQHNRNSLANLFWPESSPTHALTSLRVALAALRKYVGAYLEINRETVRFKTGAEIYLDVYDFEQKIASGQIMQAVELYQGDLLQGIYIKDSDEFENWRRWEQERLSILLSKALQTALSSEIRLGHYDSAQKLAREVLKVDPLNESVHRHYMIALALDGNRSSALEHYQRFLDLLTEEPDEAPAEETTQLMHLIREGNIADVSRQLLPENNLPVSQTSFIGRENNLQELAKLIMAPDCRLITLSGPGGTGKSRLALEAARRHSALFSDGAFYIPFEDIPSPDDIVAAIAKELRFKFDTDTYIEPCDQLLDYLRNRTILLIMDGFEHLIAGASLVSQMLAKVRGLMLVVTSRETLNIQGEWVYQVKGLPVPDSTPSEGQKSASALDLFLARAQQATPGLVLSECALKHVVSICQLLEGLPLGIELAAAWTSILSCSEIAREIESNLGFLETPMRDLAEKHHSLRATLAYSWNMLDAQQQNSMARLSVFRGGFSRQAALYIANASISQLFTLLSKSMLTRRESGRLDMHNMVRQFTAEILQKSPAMALDSCQKHSAYYTAFLKERASGLHSPRMVAIREEVRQELENIKIACQWAVMHRNEEEALDVLTHCFMFYLVHGWHEGITTFAHLAEDVMTAHPVIDASSDPLVLSIRVQQAFFYSNLGLTQESDALCKACLGPLRQLDLPRELAICLHNLGVNALLEGKYEEAVGLLEEAIQVGKNRSFVAYPSFFLWLGYVYFLLGDYEEGMRGFHTCYDLFNSFGDIWGAAFALSKMGLAADGLGQYAAAIEYNQRALEIFMETGDLAGQAYARSRLSVGAYFQEDYEVAVEYGEDAYKRFSDIGHRWGICASLTRIAFAKIGLGQIKAAKSIFLDSLQLAQENQLAPLSLCSIAGIACILMIEGDNQKALDYFRYCRMHPITPAIYIQVAERWFKDRSEEVPQTGKGEAELEPLEKVIQAVLNQPS